MNRIRRIPHLALTALLCVSIVSLSAAPPASNALKMLEIIEAHAQMVTEHGHSPGFVGDFFWPLHGHTHNIADHDHNPDTLAWGLDSSGHLFSRNAWLPARTPPTKAGPMFRLERPPRA